jgi:two-component system sensor histidine kinase ChiS
MKRSAYTLLLLMFARSFLAQDLEKMYLEAKQHLEKDNNDSALRVAKTLLEDATAKNSTKYQIEAYAILGEASFAKNNSTEALSNYFEALKIAKKSGDLVEQEFLLNNVGIVYFDQRNYTEAQKYFEDELKLKEKRGDTIPLCNSMLNLSSIYRRQKDFKKGGEYLDRVRKLAYIRKDSVLLANYYNGQASNYFGIFILENKIDAYGNDPKLWDRTFKFTSYRDSAEIYWKKSYSIWMAKMRKLSALQPLFNLGYVYQTKKDHDRALANYLVAAAIAESLGLQKEKITLYGNLAEEYYDIKNYQLSADYFRKISELRDSLQKEESRNYSEKLSKQYQLETNSTIELQRLSLELKNKEIAAQRKQIYFYILIFILLLFITAGIITYMTFNKRLNRKIEEAREKFFSNIMHEIRTPLSMIQAPLKTLRPKLNDEESLYYIQLAEKNVQRLNELISQMLDISKIENSTYTLNKKVGHPEQLFRDLLPGFEKLATEKKQHFVSTINVPHELMIFDKDALEKITGNLLSNAIKYTSDNGSVGINVNIEDTENLGRLIIEVWDTGVGIPKADQEKIFTRFFRSGHTENKASGVGIGLSLVKDIVNACKGKISFISEPGKGTKFTAEIPLERAEHAAESPAEINAESGKPVIMLIEDDQDILDFNAGFLGSKDLEIVKAKNALNAKTLLKNIAPDLIVTDLMMDGLDGLSFIKEIKGNKGLNHIPIIVLSAKSSGQTRVEVLAAGAQAFLSKPFLPEELYSVIGNQLELINKIKKELRTNIETPKPDVKAEEKFKSTEPYTQKLFDLIFKQLDNSELSVELLADLMATNRSHFQRKIKSLTGYSPSELIKMIRLEKSKEFLLAKKGNITEVAYMCGFSSQSYFTKCFTQRFGFSPTQLFSQSQS